MTYRGRAAKISDFDLTEFTCVELGSRILSTGSSDGTIKIWAIGKGGNSPILELQNHNSPVSCLNLDDKEEHLLAGFTDGSVRQWDLNEVKCNLQIPSQTRTTTHCLCHFPSYVSNVHPYVVALWRDDVVEILDLREMDKPIRNFVVSCGSPPGPSLNRKKKNLSFSPCGRWLIAYANHWNHLIILNIITSQIHDIDLNNNITCTEFHPTELILAVGTELGHVYMVNFSTMMLDPSIPIKLDFGHLLGLAYADEGKFLFGIFPDSVRLIQSDTEDVTPGNFITAEWKSVSHIHFLDSSEGLLLICSADERDLQIWISDLMKLTTSPNSSPTTSPPPEPNLEVEVPQEEHILEKLLSESQESVTNLSLRLSYVRYVNSFLKKGKLKEAMENLALLNNASFINIILNERLLKVKDDEKLSNYYTLNDLKLFFPLLKNLLSSEDKSHVEATLISLREILRNFVSTTSVKSAVGGPFFDGLVGLKKQITNFQSYGGNIAVMAKELSKQIASM